MNKQEFLNLLRRELSGLPQGEIEERVGFYAEMIDDRMEEGLTEEEAVEAVGPVGPIVLQTIADTPLTKIVKERVQPKRRMKAWEITLLVLGSPIWLSLIIAMLAVFYSVIITLWAVTISFWAAFIGMWWGVIAGGAIGSFRIWSGHPVQGLVLIGGAMVLAGVTIFFYYLCVGMWRFAIVATRRIAIWTKNLFVKKKKGVEKYA